MTYMDTKTFDLYAGSENAFYIMQNMNCGFYPFL